MGGFGTIILPQLSQNHLIVLSESRSVAEIRVEHLFTQRRSQDRKSVKVLSVLDRKLNVMLFTRRHPIIQSDLSQQTHPFCCVESFRQSCESREEKGEEGEEDREEEKREGEIQTDVVGMTVALEGDNWDAHEKTLTSGCGSGKGPGIETDVHAAVGGEMIDIL